MVAENKKFNVGDKVILAYPECEAHKAIEDFIGFVEQVADDECVIYKDDVEEGFWVKNSEIELIQKASVVAALKPQELTTIKSDGGSSSYYELTITNKAGESIKCETGDVIRALVGNDFDFGNCVKALRRMYLATLGMGKEGTDIPYDCNKVRYFLSEIERVNK